MPSNKEDDDENNLKEGEGEGEELIDEDEAADSDGDASARSNGKKKENHKHKHKHKHKKHKKKSIVLFICDPQCDYLNDGTMPIRSSKADSARLGDLIAAHQSEIQEIYVSLNSRHKTHISNPVSWVQENGESPDPYTTVTRRDVENGVYRARMPGLQDSFLEYIMSLETAERDELVLWPDHCLVGTEGHAVIPEVNEALQDWAGHNICTVEYIIKATSCATEMYSAISAEVPQAADPSTSLDTGMVERLMSADRVLIAGQSLCHTVNYTVRDMLKHWKESKTGKIYLIKDCCSALPGFESKAEDFLRDMEEAGVNVINAVEAFEWPDAAKIQAAKASKAATPALAAKKAAADQANDSGEEENVDSTVAAIDKENTATVGAKGVEGGEEDDEL